MKGVLFSADFVEDNNGGYRLLELNTDTGFISASLNNNFDFSAFKTVLSDNNITTVETVHKQFHNHFVDKLESELSGTDVTTFTRHLQDNTTMYPNSPTDASNKFILRLAYDEGALFDSTYCKERINVLTLFHENSATGSIPAFYYSGSSTTYNTLIEEDLNDHAVLPDYVQKDVSEVSEKVRFAKGGNSVSSSEDRINDAINNYVDKNNQSIEKYYFNSTQLGSTNKVESIRCFYIAVYVEAIGGFELCKLASYKVNALEEIPSSITIDSNGYNLYHQKHYYEFATNYPDDINTTGFKGTENVYNEDGTLKLFSNLAKDDRIKSFFISGSPTTDVVADFEAWNYVGATLPDPFYVTSSFVENMLSSSLVTGLMGEVKISDNESLYSGLNQHFLVHESSSNSFKFIELKTIDKDDHSLVDHSGSKIDIVDTACLLIEEQNESIYNPDVEIQDTFIVSASAPIVAHNAPCFVAGTPVTMANGERKNIEDVVVGDEVACWDFENNVRHGGVVESVRVKENEETVNFKSFEPTHLDLEGTPDHPIYVRGKGWCSYKPAQTLEDSGLEVQQLEEGDWIKILAEDYGDGGYIQLNYIQENVDKKTVYNLDVVTPHQNFYANDVLVHNRFIPSCCFQGSTQVQLGNGDHKAINEIEIGDVVRTYNVETSEYGSSTVTQLHNTTKLSDHVSRNESVGGSGMGFWFINGNINVMFTPEHPFWTKDGWKALAPDSSQEPFATEQESKTLKIGDYIFEGDEWVEVYDIQFASTEEDEAVYNITVENTHTYLVDGILVHNK